MSTEQATHEVPTPTTDALEGTDAADTGAGAEAQPDGAAADGHGQPAEGGPERRSRLERLEEEGEVAADYLEELLDIADLDGDIDIDVEDGRAAVSVVAEGSDAVALRRLAGARGEVLEALQDLTRLAVQARTGERSRLMLDVAGHRARRREELQQLAAQAVAEVQRDGAPVALEPMNPFERKVVHDAVAAAGLVSDSEGEEPHRHVVVSPAA
ncbi:spoIIIJ-associated protein [Quadrisphaera granulorum]|uniref:SpoIIIJ-associated protein n=1 Tax=Quadrisphaera granulorum TaxID=317664 RepID=A0A316ADD3_9ACTN|nr:R3H domain-containing nucleic acid-binding protein [Quadrisphaera granulorum]PWJ55765.1 spoIIIJ-associated protein [Quadrisphaera granulorum]SZE95262.1 spoIIIJ-associated protein [Quadrisphaera granulorum]